MNKLIAVISWSFLAGIVYIGYSYPLFGMLLIGMQIQAVSSMYFLKGWDYTKEYFTMMSNPYLGKPLV